MTNNEIKKFYEKNGNQIPILTDKRPDDYFGLGDEVIIFYFADKNPLKIGKVEKVINNEGKSNSVNVFLGNGFFELIDIDSPYIMKPKEFEYFKVHREDFKQQLEDSLESKKIENSFDRSALKDNNKRFVNALNTKKLVCNYSQLDLYWKDR